MNELLKNISKVIRRVEAKKGPFTFFALFSYEGESDLYDVVVSAPWLDEAKLEDLRYLSTEIAGELSQDERMMLSRIAPVMTTSITAVAHIGARDQPVDVSDLGMSFLDGKVKAGFVFVANPAVKRPAIQSAGQSH